MADTYLSVVDESDEVVERALRSVVHRDGLLHREVHVWFIRPNGELILQRRSATKDTFPLMLDATVGGHVEEGQSYLQAAIAEVFEETGIRLGERDLHLLASLWSYSVDIKRGATNNARRHIFVHPFLGDVADLVVEEGDGAGFETMMIDDVVEREDARLREFVPSLLQPESSVVWNGLMGLIQETRKVSA